MSELQATVEFSIELHKFYNVDLFQRGFYQIRTSLKVSPKIPVKIEVTLPRNQKSEHVFSPFVANGCGISRIFQILYRNQEVLLDNVILFRVHLLVDSYKIEETLERADFTMNVELWFTEQPYLLSQQNGTCVSVRTLHFHFSPVKGLHYHLPVLFDYFHLAAVTITIHSILVALHQPYIKKSILHYMQSCTPRSTKTFFGTPHHLHSNQSTSIDALFFGNTHSTKCVSTGARLAHARYVHQEVCSILLTTYDTLQTHLHDYMKLLPTWQQLKLETNDCLKRLNSLSDAAKLIEAEDDFISVANSDIAQLCAENILLWQQFLDAFTSKIPILQHLAKFHHQLRVKRFSEAFFVVDNPRQSAAGCYDSNYQNYVAVSETVRRSRYLSSLPSLPVTCMELDGDITTMPIIFEDQYKDVLDFSRRRNDAARKSGSDPALNINIPVHSLKEECSCGIVAILESRSQKISSHSSSSQQNFYSLKAIRPNSFSILKEGKENTEKEKSKILGSYPGKEANTNISGFSQVEKQKKNVKTLGVSSYKTLLNSRQRHSKSLDHLKNTKARLYQVPATLNSITRSISSQMPYNTNRSIVDGLNVNNSKYKISLFKKTEKEGTFSPSSDSCDSEGSNRKLGPSLSVPYSLCEYPFFRNNDVSLTKKMKHSESTLSMPNTNVAFIDKYKDCNSFLEENSSESMPNLIQSPNESPKKFDVLSSKYNYRKVSDTKDILSLYEINNPTIIEETTDDHCTIFEINTPKETILSSPLSSGSDEIASEQSGWVSNSSRHSSETQSSSGAPSPEATIPSQKSSKSSHDKTVSLPLDSFFSGDILIKKLKKLAISSEQLCLKSNDRLDEDVRLPPPYQFRDVPSPPEHFKDSPDPAVLNDSQSHISKDSIDDILHRFYDFDVDKKVVKKKKDFKVSIENLALDFFKETKKRDRNYNRRNKRREKEKKLKATSDEGFDELEAKHNDSDTSITMEFFKENKMKIKTGEKIKNSFHGYLFKEDLETLRKIYEKKENKNWSFNKQIEQISFKSNKYVNDETKTQQEDKTNFREKKYKLKIKDVNDEKSNFIKAKEEFKRQMNFTGTLYSDFPTLASTLPYFHISDEYRIFSPEGLHLIVCVHGLDGNSNDLRLVKTYVELGLPGANLEFLMSERNQGDTFSDFETMTDKLVAEILHHIESCGPNPSKISFIGHSLGNIIIRSAITRPQLKHLLPCFHTFLSLSGPHLGTLYNNSGLVNMGMWFMQKWKKSGSLLQLSLKDAPDVRQSFLYRLSQKSNLHRFRHVLLCGSSQDRYVPMHSARIELCKAAIKDTTIQGVVYKEMVHNIINPVINSSETTLVRYDIHHALPNTANSLIGRAAHIAVLDSELFIEKFLVVTGLKYFR